MSRTAKVITVIVLILLIDQSLKIWVKTHMEYGDQIPLFGDWGMLNFVENPGMAFGFTFGGDLGKLSLSVFRIIAVILLSFYLRSLIRTKEVATGILICIAMILAGAMGNIIDSAFYGIIFSESPYHGGLAQLFPEEGGYGSFLHGKVVDMFYFPLFEGTFPKWFPFWGGESFLFFRPIFNVADAAISLGVAGILIFYRNFFSEEKKKEVTATTATKVSAPTEHLDQKDTAIKSDIAPKVVPEPEEKTDSSES